MDRGLSYDYGLPVDEMHRWYEPLVRVLGLVRTVSHGWNHSTRWFRGAARRLLLPYAPRWTALRRDVYCFRVQGVFDRAFSTAARRPSARRTRRICRANGAY